MKLAVCLYKYFAYGGLARIFAEFWKFVVMPGMRSMSITLNGMAKPFLVLSKSRFQFPG